MKHKNSTLAFMVTTSLVATAGLLGNGSLQSASAATLTDLLDGSTLVELTSTGDLGTNTKNDCSGFFGQGFENCVVQGPTGTPFSPVVAKFDTTPTNLELNGTEFPSIDGSEFDFDPSQTVSGVDYPTAASTGTWTYTPNDTGNSDSSLNDPIIRYWVAKGGNEGFNLFFVVPTSAVTGGTCTTSDSWTDACLAEALSVTGGTWQTPSNQALSHITFYDSRRGGGGGPGPQRTPEPSALGSLGVVFGLMGISGLRRRRLKK